MNYKKLLILPLFLTLYNWPTTASKVDSLLHVYQTSPVDTIKANSLISVAIELLGHNTDSALALTLNAMGILKRANNDTIKGRAFNTLGRIYFAKSDYKKAMDNFISAQKIWKRLNWTSKVYSIEINMGAVNVQIKNYAKALELFTHALEYKLKENDLPMIALVNMNIGLCYLNMGQFDKALEQNLATLKYVENFSTPNHLIQLYNNLGATYIHFNQNLKAVEYYEKALSLAAKHNMPDMLALAMGNLGNIYINLKQFDKAEYYLNTALESSKKFGSIYYQKQCYEGLTYLYETKSDFQSALKYNKLLIILSDSMYNIENTRIVNEMLSKYNMDQKQLEIELLKKDNDLKEREKSIQRIIIFSAFSGIILILILALLIFNRYRLKKKSNRQLELVNSELQKLSIVASKTDNCVLICNHKGEIEWVNDGYTRLFVYTIDDLKKKGKTLVEISAHNKIKEVLSQSISTRHSVTYETVNTTKDGKELWLHSTLTPIFDQNGELTKLVVIDTDLTVQKKHEKIIESKNESILDSLQYASSIQEIILPVPVKLSKAFKDFFILYRPKDIVSGDFCWIGEKDNKIIFAVADCIGHGVPGALMSILGYHLLENVLSKHPVRNAAQFLNDLDIEVKATISRTTSETNIKNIMDISLLIYDNKTGALQFAGARNSLYQVSKGSIMEYKADRIVLGELQNSGEEFTNHNVVLSKGDMLYLFSDGYVDQKGGTDGRKFFYNPFQKLILSLKNESMQRQKEILNETFDIWKGDIQQIDDVMIVGLKI